MAHYPWYVWTPVLIGVIGIVALTAVGLRQAGARIAAGFAVAWSAWIAVSATLAYGGVYGQVGNPPWIAVAVGGALAALLLAARIRPVRAAFTTPADLAGLVWPQSLRVVGGVFLIAMALGGIPAVFALPAGLGDMAVGIGAVVIARRLARGDRAGAVWFTVLGLTDLVVAVSLGFLAGLGPIPILAVTPSTADLAVLPLVLIPTTAVPLVAALHLVSLSRLRGAAVAAAQPVAVVG
jgi:hypothetical protein